MQREENGKISREAKRFSLWFELSPNTHKLDGVERKGGEDGGESELGGDEGLRPQSSCFKEENSEP